MLQMISNALLYYLLHCILSGQSSQISKILDRDCVLDPVWQRHEGGYFAKTVKLPFHDICQVGPLFPKLIQ